MLIQKMLICRSIILKSIIDTGEWLVSFDSCCRWVGQKVQERPQYLKCSLFLFSSFTSNSAIGNAVESSSLWFPESLGIVAFAVP